MCLSNLPVYFSSFKTHFQNFLLCRTNAVHCSKCRYYVGSLIFHALTYNVAVCAVPHSDGGTYSNGQPPHTIHFYLRRSNKMLVPNLSIIRRFNCIGFLCSPIKLIYSLCSRPHFIETSDTTKRGVTVTYRQTTQ